MIPCAAIPLLLTAHAAGAGEDVRLGIFAKVTAPEGAAPAIDATRLLEALARDAEWALGVTVVGPSELLTTDAGRSSSECGADLGCLAARLRGAGIDLGLVATADVGAEAALVLVMLVRGAPGEVGGRIIDEAPADDPAAIAAAIERGAVRLLEEAGHPLGGRLHARVSPPDAILTLRDPLGNEVSAPAEGALLLRPGVYLARARSEGRAERAVEVKIEARAEAELSLALEPEAAWHRSPWFWAGAAILIAGTVAAGVALAGSGGGGRELIPGEDGRVIFTLRLGP